MSQIYRVLNFKEKVLFIVAFLVINLSFKDYKFYEIRSKSQWKSYFELMNEQKYIDSLAKKYSGKKVLIYGAGIIAEELFEHYDLSKINIVGISDKRFERTNEKSFFNIKTVAPKDLKHLDFDTILFTLKLHNGAYKSLQASGINKKADSLIKKSLKYPIRS